jgi:hypothetical protein
MIVRLFRRKEKRDAFNIRKQIPEISDDAVHALGLVKPYTMTSVERLWAMWQSLTHIAAANIPGDIVECGVWKGGNLALAGLVCDAKGLDRSIYGFDTYTGMTAPTASDGASALGKFEKFQREGSEWCYSPLDEVKANIARVTKYDRYRFIAGKCEDTLSDPANLPEQISILRLDTDWYESTKAELEVLYPRLSPGGILILDDYGHWGGARQAADEYFSTKPALLSRIDYTGRLHIKP